MKKSFIFPDISSVEWSQWISLIWVFCIKKWISENLHKRLILLSYRPGDANSSHCHCSQHWVNGSLSQMNFYHNNTPTLQPTIVIATLPDDAEGLREQPVVTITTAPLVDDMWKQQADSSRPRALLLQRYLTLWLHLKSSGPIRSLYTGMSGWMKQSDLSISKGVGLGL